MSDGGRARALAALQNMRSQAADGARRALAREVASLAEVQSEWRALEESLGALGEAQARAEAFCRARTGEVGPAYLLQSADRRVARIRSLRSRAEPWRAEQRARAVAAEWAVTRARSTLAQIEGARRAVDELLAKLRLERARRVEGAEETETAAMGPDRSGPLSRASS